MGALVDEKNLVFPALPPQALKLKCTQVLKFPQASSSSDVCTVDSMHQIHANTCSIWTHAMSRSTLPENSLRSGDVPSGWVFHRFGGRPYNNGSSASSESPQQQAAAAARDFRAANRGDLCLPLSWTSKALYLSIWTRVCCKFILLNCWLWLRTNPLTTG